MPEENVKGMFSNLLVGPRQTLRDLIIDCIVYFVLFTTMLRILQEIRDGKTCAMMGPKSQYQFTSTKTKDLYG